MKYGVEYILPTIFTKLWVFLRVMDVLKNFFDDFYELRGQA
jgi:hypothetical protein